MVFLDELRDAPRGDALIEFPAGSDAADAVIDALNAGNRIITIAIDAESGTNQVVLESSESTDPNLPKPTLVVETGD